MPLGIDHQTPRLSDCSVVASEGHHDLVTLEQARTSLQPGLPGKGDG